VSDVLVVATGLSKNYGRTRAVVDVSVTVGRGEVLGLMGPNGSGKSTLARLLLGFSKPTEGTVTVDGLTAREFRRTRGVGFLPEELGRDLPIRGRDLLEVRVPMSDASSVIEALELDPLLDKPLSQLSKGQWRRMLAAYALIGETELVVLDEPDSGLDVLALDGLQAAIRIASGRGAAVVVLSHSLDELWRACDRIGIMRDGEMRTVRDISDMTAEEVRDLYREVAR
jgi:ABC-type multidrug transport system ATPase subunit